MKVPPRAIAALLSLSAAIADAQVPAADGAPADAPVLAPVTVTATRVEQRGFDVPAAVDVLDADAIRAQRPGVNLSEGLAAMPGIAVRNRQNYAQDLQVSSRGFGARASFGTRGVRLVQDGIPFTMPDGQGQTAMFALDSARRVEALRGPFAALYGNSSGGVISVFTDPPPRDPTAQVALFGGSHGSWKLGLGASASQGALGASVDFSRFGTDGFRDHSRALRELAGAKVRWTPDANTTLSLGATVLDQPFTQDPLGLTREQLAQDRRQAGSGALAFDTRKRIEHRQVGLSWERRIGPDDVLTVRAYAGEREVRQFLAFSGAAATSSGGVVDLDRGFGGASLQWTRTLKIAGGPASLTLGVDHDTMNERRRGFVNDGGVAGALRRDESNTVSNLDPYLIGEWWFAPRWKISGGVRSSQVRFDVRDDFVNGSNPDDSGGRRYSATSPVLGLLHALTDRVNVFVAAGRGFETPTFTELAYRADGQPGLNFALDASRGTQFEAGMKAGLADGVRASLVAFGIDTRNDIVPDRNVAGRATFRNAARTERRGIELALDAALGGGVHGWIAYTRTDARFRDYFDTAGEDLSGKALPGVAGHALHAELAWRERRSGFVSALEASWLSRVFADDANAEHAEAYAILNLRAGFDWRGGGWRVAPFVRVDNVFGRKYVGSVIVNASNGRYYEPAPTRSFLAGVRASLRF